jgi:hypothetical protein
MAELPHFMFVSLFGFLLVDFSKSVHIYLCLLVLAAVVVAILLFRLAVFVFLTTLLLLTPRSPWTIGGMFFL